MIAGWAVGRSVGERAFPSSIAGGPAEKATMMYRSDPSVRPSETFSWPVSQSASQYRLPRAKSRSACCCSERKKALRTTMDVINNSLSRSGHVMSSCCSLTICEYEMTATALWLAGWQGRRHPFSNSPCFPPSLPRSSLFPPPCSLSPLALSPSFFVTLSGRVARPFVLSGQPDPVASRLYPSTRCNLRGDWARVDRSKIAIT